MAISDVQRAQRQRLRRLAKEQRIALLQEETAIYSVLKISMRVLLFLRYRNSDVQILHHSRQRRLACRRKMRQ